MLGALYGFIAIIISPFMLLGSMLSEGGRIGGLVVAVMLVVFYPIAGFIGGIITAAVYNFTAGMFGGIEITLDSDDGTPTE